jgi:TrmH family RNA methyltransferase
MAVIDSPQNQYVKRLRLLATRKGRAEHCEFLVEGVRALEEALVAEAPLKLAAFCPELAVGERAQALVEQLRSSEAELLEMTERAFRAFSQVEAPEGVAAAVAIPGTGLGDLPGNAALVVAAVEARDPGNMGALLRTADAAGADAFIAAGSCVELHEPKVVRATAGSIFHIPAVQDVTAAEMMAWAGGEGMATVAACLGDARPYAEVQYPPRTLVMLGNEAHGLSPDVAGQADFRVFIPMPGRAQSLNVAVAAGILVFEILRQRGKTKDDEGEK